MRHTGSDEDDEYQELDERLDYNIPESFRVIVRCVASLVLAPCLIYIYIYIYRGKIKSLRGTLHPLHLFHFIIHRLHPFIYFIKDATYALLTATRQHAT